MHAAAFQSSSDAVWPAAAAAAASQAIGLLDDLDKELNTYAMRVREWYGWHFPEMTKIVADNIAYAKAVSHGLGWCAHPCAVCSGAACLLRVLTPGIHQGGVAQVVSLMGSPWRCCL